MVFPDKDARRLHSKVVNYRLMEPRARDTWHSGSIRKNSMSGGSGLGSIAYRSRKNSRSEISQLRFIFAIPMEIHWNLPWRRSGGLNAESRRRSANAGLLSGSRHGRPRTVLKLVMKSN